MTTTTIDATDATAQAAPAHTSVVRLFSVRLRHDRGHWTVTTGGSDADARREVANLLDTEHAPVRSVVWVKLRPTCDRCDRPATRYYRGGQEDPVCQACALDDFGNWADMRAGTGELGITRMHTLDPAEWLPMPYAPECLVCGYQPDGIAGLVVRRCGADWDDAGHTDSAHLPVWGVGTDRARLLPVGEVTRGMVLVTGEVIENVDTPDDERGAVVITTATRGAVPIGQPGSHAVMVRR